MGEVAVLLHAPRQESIACSSCGVVFMMPATLLQNRRDDGHSFYCPNGHSMAWTKTKADRLEEELVATKKTLEAARARQAALESEVAVAARRVSAARGEITKVKNRVGNGVCPCCNRTFQNLMAHMKTKHPKFKDEGATGLAGEPKEGNAQ